MASGWRLWAWFLTEKKPAIINGRMNNWVVIYSYKRILYSNEKEWCSNIHINVYESHKCNVKQKKLDMVLFLSDGEEKQAKRTIALWSREVKHLEGAIKKRWFYGCIYCAKLQWFVFFSVCISHFRKKERLQLKDNGTKALKILTERIGGFIRTEGKKELLDI